MNTVNMANAAVNRPEGVRTWRVGSLSMIVGTTMYVMIGSVDRRDGGIIYDELTLIVPVGVELSERGR